MEIIRKVEEKGLANRMKSGSLPVLATPQMIAWMEEAATLALNLPAGKTSVGIEIQVSHEAAVLAGTLVTIRAELLEEQGKILVFAVSAWKGDVCLGKGIHKRAVVDENRFIEKLLKPAQ